MAYDGIAAAAAVKELNDKVLNGSISKVAQPEKDELLLTLKCSRQAVRLCISANASTPMVCLKEENALSPVTAPNFCMALRKHIGGGRIRRIFQPSSAFSAESVAAEKEAMSSEMQTGDIPAGSHGLERIIVFEIEHIDEMGDLSRRYLIAEIMGKHSNIILTKDDLTIIDSIKHVSHMTSSVREVLPGRPYFIPDASEKTDPLELAKDATRFSELIMSRPVLPVIKKLYMSLTGISPTMAGELLWRAGISEDLSSGDLGEADVNRLFEDFSALMQQVEEGRFEPCILYEGDRISEFSGVRLRSLEGGELKAEFFDSMSEVIRRFYEKKDRQNRIRSKSEDIRHVLKTLTERASRKLDLLEKQYADTEKREKFRIYGELLNTYGYSLQGGEEFLECENYYDENRLIRIPLDPDFSAGENAARYFDRYQKLKRTREAVGTQITECWDMLYHLDSIGASLALCESEADLNELRREMADSGYIRHQNGRKDRREEQKSKPMHFVSSDGLDIYVGRNNYQNEELDFKIADNQDWWFHAKNIPGSHVIVKTGGRELPDQTCLEAAALAAYYSKAVMGNAGAGSSTAGAGGRNTPGTLPKIEVDYVKKKELKRVPGAAPGFVIYHTNYSILIEPRDRI